MSELYTGTAVIFKVQKILDSHLEGIRKDSHYIVGRYCSNLQGILKRIHKLLHHKSNQD
jgi:hypothetical protein